MHHNSKASILQRSAFFIVQFSHSYMTTGKTIALSIWTLVSKVTSLLFNMLSRFVVAFLPRSKHLLISWLKSPSAVILEPKKRKFVAVFTFPPFICHEVIGLDAMIIVLWMLSFKPAFSLCSFTLINRLFNSYLLFAIRVVACIYEAVDISPRNSWFQLTIHPAWHFAWCTLHKSEINRVTKYSLDILLSQFWTNLFFPVWFWMLLLNLYTGFSGGR